LGEQDEEEEDDLSLGIGHFSKLPALPVSTRALLRSHIAAAVHCFELLSQSTRLGTQSYYKNKLSISTNTDKV